MLITVFIMFNTHRYHMHPYDWLITEREAFVFHLIEERKPEDQLKEKLLSVRCDSRFESLAV